MSVSGNGSSDGYLAVLQTCNTLVHSLGKNLWSKYFPGESANGAQVNLQFDIEPGDSTPRRLMVCLAKQVHNFKCVAKILDCVKEAEKALESLEDAEDAAGDSVNLALLASISSQLTVLAKCDAAMRRRHSVRHRVLPVESGKVACFALCDIDCPVLGIRLSQLESYILIDTSSHQSWLVAEAKSGCRLRVPPVLLAVEAETAELARIGRVRTKLRGAASRMVAGLAGQLAATARGLRTGGQEELRQGLGSSDIFQHVLYRLQMLERFLKALAASQDGLDAQMTSADWRSLLETIEFLMERLQLASAAKPTSIAAQLIKMQNGLGVLKTFVHVQEVTERLRSLGGGGGCSSRRSLCTGRSHQLKSPHRRTSMFEFEFEFLESTQKRSTVSRRVVATTRFTSETVTRQRQEVARKFVIQSVWNGRREVSLQEAIDTKVIDFQRGIYVERLGSRVEMPLEAAMSAGKIRVEMVTSEQVSEDNSSYGLINVEESRQTEEGKEPVVTTVAYVVHAVVDVAGKRRLNFQEAAQLGLIDRETGAFTNSSTGEVLPAGEAITKGFFKAYTVDDPRSLDIDPENRNTVQNFSRLKNKLSVVNAFARKTPGKGGKDN